MPSDNRYVDTHTQYTTEAPVYCKDFSDFPEVQAGGVLSAPTMTAVAGLTFTGCQVTAAPFTERGQVVPAGKGVKVKIASTTPGTYEVAFNVTVTEADGTVTPRTGKMSLVVI